MPPTDALSLKIASAASEAEAVASCSATNPAKKRGEDERGEREEPTQHHPQSPCAVVYAITEPKKKKITIFTPRVFCL